MNSGIGEPEAKGNKVGTSLAIILVIGGIVLLVLAPLVLWFYITCLQVVLLVGIVLMWILSWLIGAVTWCLLFTNWMVLSAPDSLIIFKDLPDWLGVILILLLFVITWCGVALVLTVFRERVPNYLKNDAFGHGFNGGLLLTFGIGAIIGAFMTTRPLPAWPIALTIDPHLAPFVEGSYPLDIKGHDSRAVGQHRADQNGRHSN